MKHPRIPLLVLLVLTACALLTGCGSTADTSSSAPAESEASSSVSASAEVSTSVKTATTSVPFTETDSFPFPFSEELALTKSTPQTLYLTREQAQYDYDTLWQLLEENYPYFDAIREEKGLDYRTVRQEYQTRLDKLASDDTVTVEDFASFISRCLREFYPVGHLLMIDDPTSFFDGWPRDNEKYSNLADIGTNGKSATVYSYISHGQTSYNTPGYTQLDVPNGVPQSAGSGVTLGYANNVPYIKLTSMQQWTDDTISVVAEFLAENRDAANMIIDIRNNGGGTDSAWMTLIRLMTPEPLSWSTLYAAKAGSLNQYINPDFCTSTDWYYIYTDDSWQDAFPNIPAENLAGMDIIVSVSSGLTPADNSIGYTGKLWLLVNRGVYSSADTFAYTCTQTGFATLVGQTTRGNSGIQPHVLALPWSGLLVYYDAYINFNADGSCNGIIGTQPDYEVDAVTALTECLKLIEAGG